ncbi:hypothetical protein CR513_47786, partial [Mucuna pruriens]
MFPTLQETESDQPENVGAIGGFQYGKQPYQNRPFDNQQHGRQPFRPGLNQGPYAAQQFGSTLNAYQRQAGYQQSTRTTFPTTTTAVETAYLGQLPISRRLDEATCNKQPRVSTICEL